MTKTLKRGELFLFGMPGSELGGSASGVIAFDLIRGRIFGYCVRRDFTGAVRNTYSTWIREVSVSVDRYLKELGQRIV